MVKSRMVDAEKCSIWSALLPKKIYKKTHYILMVLMKQTYTRTLVPVPILSTLQVHGSVLAPPLFDKYALNVTCVNLGHLGIPQCISLWPVTTSPLVESPEWRFRSSDLVLSIAKRSDSLDASFHQAFKPPCGFCACRLCHPAGARMYSPGDKHEQTSLMKYENAPRWVDAKLAGSSAVFIWDSVTLQQK